jgi:hypothetical protein
LASSLLVPAIYSILRLISSSRGTNQRFAQMEESIQELVSRPIYQEDRNEAKCSKQPTQDLEDNG